MKRNNNNKVKTAIITDPLLEMEKTTESSANDSIKQEEDRDDLINIINLLTVCKETVESMPKCRENIETIKSLKSAIIWQNARISLAINSSNSNL